MSRRVNPIPAEGQSRTQERTRKMTAADMARDIIAVKNTPSDKVGRWVNDVDGKVQKALDLGYQFVPADTRVVGDPSVDNTGSNVGEYRTKAMGKGVTAYYMEQRKDWYDEDQMFKQTMINSTEQGLREQDNEDPLRYGKVEIGDNRR